MTALSNSAASGGSSEQHSKHFNGLPGAQPARAVCDRARNKANWLCPRVCHVPIPRCGLRVRLGAMSLNLHRHMLRHLFYVSILRMRKLRHRLWWRKLLPQTRKMQRSFRSTCAPEPACPAGKPRLWDRVSESTPQNTIVEIEMILPPIGEFLRGLLTWGRGVKCILGWMSFYFNTEEFISNTVYPYCINTTE